VIVIADSDNWSTEIPALTVSLRGLVDCVVEVATLDHGLHSGLWGGVVPDALSVLVRLLASLHDDDGNVAVAGLHETDVAGLNYPEYPAGGHAPIPACWTGCPRSARVRCPSGCGPNRRSR